MKIAIVIFVVLLCYFLLHMYMIKPRKRRVKEKDFPVRYYAHRGLHNNAKDNPENTIKAFKMAVEKGYGIELDVQLTKDGIPVVFHDFTLKRVCNVNGRVIDYTYEELKKYKILLSDECIPTFAEVLNIVNGKVPLIIEVKVLKHDCKDICQKISEILKEYNGVYCIESFHPLCLYWFRKNRPEIIRGQLATNFFKESNDFPLIIKRELTNLLFNCITKPDFIAYDWKYKNALSRRACSNIYKSYSAAWTIRSKDALESCKKDFDCFIFEGFMPDAN